MNNESPTGNAGADAPVPLAGTEHAADQAEKQQKPEESSGVLKTTGDAIEMITDAVDAVRAIASVFE